MLHRLLRNLALATLFLVAAAVPGFAQVVEVPAAVGFFERILANWESYAGVVALFVLAFERLASLTPTDADNAVVRTLQRLFAILGVKVPDVQRIETKPPIA